MYTLGFDVKWVLYLNEDKKIKNVFYVTGWPKTMEEWEENFLLVWQTSEVYQP